MPTSVDLSVWRQAAVALCRYACGDDKGRGKDDLVYREVTEGRDGPGDLQRAAYSSCGDLAHWLLERLGVREKWVNRQSLGHYQIGSNVYDLGLGCSVSHPAPTASDWAGPEVGDICEIWNASKGQDAHVFVMLGSSEKAGGKLLTANFGAGGCSTALWPGARLSDSSLQHTAAGWYVGSRKMQRIIRLADYVQHITAQPNLTGAELPGEVTDALGAVWSANE